MDTMLTMCCSDVGSFLIEYLAIWQHHLHVSPIHDLLCLDKGLPDGQHVSSREVASEEESRVLFLHFTL